MAKRQNFIVGSTNPVTASKTPSQLNLAWDRYAVLHAADLDGVFKAVSDYSNDSSNEIANAVLKLSGSQPTGASQTELGDAIDAKINLAATSGTMILDEGVWYAKMLAATVAPSAENGTNYADFSQTDQDDNPIIVVYERQSDAWVQIDTVTPPADYDGYVLVTSKIWDIPEQAGQQGGRIMWNHTAKTFTPYPQIVSFHDIAVTGDSTVVMPANPGVNQIVNKDYVDNHAGYRPALLSHEWDDHIRNDIQWVRADTFSWLDGSVYEAAYQHLVDDYDNISTVSGQVVQISVTGYTGMYDRDSAKDSTTGTHTKAFTCFSTALGGVYGKTIYADTDTVTGSTDFYETPTSATSFGHPAAVNTGNHKIPDLEIIDGVEVRYFTAADGHKICVAAAEGMVASAYAATGVAWYYILDKTNHSFKLPRTKFAETGLRDTVGKYVEPGLPDHSHTVTAAYIPGGNAIDGGNNYQKISSGTLTTDNASASNSIYGNSTTVQPAATQMYLYFYVGNFSQTALENTAGLNAELFNDKLDLDAGNATSTTKETVIGWMLPDYANATQETAPFTATANGFIYFSASAYGAGNSCDLNIDGITACGANASIASFTVPIAKGSTATIVNTGSGSGSIKFIPCKGN